MVANVFFFGGGGGNEARRLREGAPLGLVAGRFRPKEDRENHRYGSTKWSSAMEQAPAASW